MARKITEKKTTNELPEQGEVITKTTTETITREPKKDEPEIVFDDDVLLDDTELDDEEPLSPLELFLKQISETKENVKIVVWRMPDAHCKGEFKQPCNSLTYKGTFPFEPGMTPEDVYDTARDNFLSGGRYRFQLRYGTTFGKSWEEVISDPVKDSQPQTEPQQLPVSQNTEPQKTDTEAAMDMLDRIISINQKINPQQIAAPISAQPPADPLDTALNVLDKITDISERITPKTSATPSDNVGMVGQIAMLAEALGLRDIIKPFGGMFAASIAQAAQQKMMQGKPQHQRPLANQNGSQVLNGNSSLNTVEPSHQMTSNDDSHIAVDSQDATVNFQETPAVIPENEDAEDEPFNFQTFFQDVAERLAANVSVDETAEECISLMSDMGYAIALQGMFLEQPVNDELIAALSGVCGVDLTQYPHAEMWLKRLQQKTKELLAEKLSNVTDLRPSA